MYELLQFSVARRCRAVWFFFRESWGKFVCPCAEWECDTKAVEGIGTGMLQPAFIMKSGQVIKGSCGINCIKRKYLSAMGLQNFSPAHDFHQIAVAKPAVFKFWNFLLCTLWFKSDVLQDSQEAFGCFLLPHET